MITAAVANEMPRGTVGKLLLPGVGLPVVGTRYSSLGQSALASSKNVISARYTQVALGGRVNSMRTSSCRGEAAVVL